MSSPPADPVSSFQEAVAWFRSRVPMTDEAFAEFGEAARARAFRIAGAADLRLVTDVWQALERAVAQGETLADFKAAVGERLAAAWGGDDPARLETIFRTNVQTAYSRGRWDQMTEPEVVKARPFWRFNAVLDPRTTPICRPLEDVILPADDPWWKTHAPPLHFRCRSAIETLTERQAQREGGAAAKPPDVHPAQGFGEVDREWAPDLAKYPPELAAAYREKSAGPKSE